MTESELRKKIADILENGVDPTAREIDDIMAIVAPLVADKGRGAGELLLDAVEELLEVAALRGENEYICPEDDPQLWTARRNEAWDCVQETYDKLRRNSAGAELPNEGKELLRNAAAAIVGLAATLECFQPNTTEPEDALVNEIDNYLHTRAAEQPAEQPDEA